MSGKMTDDQRFFYEMINKRFDRIEDAIKEDKQDTNRQIETIKKRVDGHDRIIWKASGVGLVLGFIASFFVKKI